LLPLAGNTHIVSCGEGGEVRLAELSPAGLVKSTRKIAQHYGDASCDVAFYPCNPHNILSAGLDGIIRETDIRMMDSAVLLRVIQFLLLSLECKIVFNIFF
jgi:hypothetical protein